MANNVGYITDNDGDLVIRAGTFAKGVSEGCEAQRIIMSMPGDLKFAPSIGCGARRMIGQPLSLDARNRLFRRIRKQLTDDGLTVNSIESTGSLTLSVDVSRP